MSCRFLSCLLSCRASAAVSTSPDGDIFSADEPVKEEEEEEMPSP